MLAPVVTTSATTNTLPRLGPPMTTPAGVEVVYVLDGDSAPTVAYAVEPHPPTPREGKPTR
jgi:hypothetical protein